MVDPISLADVRRQIRLDDDDVSEDPLLTGYMVAARRVCVSQTGFSLADGAANGPSADDVDVIAQAMLMMVAHWYENREDSEPPAMALWLLGLIRGRSI